MPTATISGTSDTIDCYLDSGSPTTNTGTSANISVGEISVATNFFYRGLIRFDLSSIPTSATVSSSTLYLYINNNFASNTRTMRVYRCLRAWTESGATWNTYDGSNNWGTAGANNTTTDREGTDIGSVSIPATPAADTEYAISLTASAIEEMVSGAFTNNGFVLKMDTELNDFHNFRSSEYTTDTSKIPKLEVVYSTGSGSDSLTLLGVS